MKRPTLKDVAQRVGVSAATVSRFVNDPRRVRPGLRERIQRAIDELAYVPHAGARALVVAGRPFGEPVARYGPFVMNTREEILAAIDDFRSGRL